MESSVHHMAAIELLLYTHVLLVYTEGVTHRSA